MSVFTRLRKSFRLDSVSDDRPHSPGSFHSGDATAEKDSVAWLHAQYVPPPLVGDKHHRRLGSATVLSELDADDQAANVIYINSSDSPAQPSHSSANSNTPRSASNTPSGSTSSHSKRPNSLMPSPAPSRYPIPTSASSQSIPTMQGHPLTRKRSATVQGHETQSTHPYARALETSEFGERSDSINWVQSLKSTTPNSATSSSASSRTPKSSSSGPSSATSSSEPNGMGNSPSRKTAHSRQRSVPAPSGRPTPPMSSMSSSVTSSPRRAPPPPIHVPSIKQRPQPTAERPQAPKIAPSENRELERVVEEVDQEDDRSQGRPQTHPPSHASTVSRTTVPTAATMIAPSSGQDDKAPSPTTTKPPTPPSDQKPHPPKLVRPPNPLLAHLPPSNPPTEEGNNGGNPETELEDIDKESLSLLHMRELLVSSGLLEFDPYPSDPPRLSLRHQIEKQPEEGDKDSDAQSMRSTWREFCRASGMLEVASFAEGSTPVAVTGGATGVAGNVGKQLPPQPRERKVSRTSSVRQDSATLPGDVLQKAQEEFMERMERLSIKSGKSIGVKRSNSKTRSVMKKSVLTPIPTASTGISWLGPDPSPTDFPIPPSLWDFLKEKVEMEMAPEVAVTSASPEKEKRDSAQEKPESPASSEAHSPVSVGANKRHIRRSMSESSIFGNLKANLETLSADGHGIGSSVALPQIQECERPAISPTQFPLSAAYSAYDVGLSPLPPPRSPPDSQNPSQQILGHASPGATGEYKKRVTSIALEDLPFDSRWTAQEEPLKEEEISSPEYRDGDPSTASSLPTPPLLVKDSATSLSASSSPSTALWTLSGNNSGSSVNLNNVNRSVTTVATSIRTEVQTSRHQSPPIPASQAQKRISILFERPGSSGSIGPGTTKQGSRASNLSLLSIGGTDRRPSAPNIGEQPKVPEQRRPSLPLGKRLVSETGSPRLPIGGSRRDSFFGARPQPHRKPPPESSVPQTVRTASPTLSVESIGPALPNQPRLGSSPSGSSAISFLPHGQSSHLFNRDRSNSHSSIRSQRSNTVSASGPDFCTIPIRWRGLTMDAAKWTMTSEELQDLVREAIQHSAKAVSIRLLSNEILKREVPQEMDRLEHQAEQIQRKYRVQVRRRRVICKSLSLYIDGSDPATARRLTEELADASATSDALAEDLYQVTDQLAQLQHLHDNHYTSALAMALRKINGSLLTKTKQVDDLREKVKSLEAEREYAWSVARTVEDEIASINELMHASHPPSSFTSHHSGTLERSNSRVEAARKGASRISQANLHLASSKRSLRSSVGSSRYPSRPSSSIPGDDIPPVPPVPLTAVTLQSIQSESPSQVNSARTSSVPAETYDEAQAALMDLLGLGSHDLQPNRRRSASFCSPRESGYSTSSKDESRNSPLRVRSSSGSLRTNPTRRHSLSALNPSDDPLIKPQLST